MAASGAWPTADAIAVYGAHGPVASLRRLHVQGHRATRDQNTSTSKWPPERIEALRDLIELRKPIPVAISGLRRFPWDSDAELVTFTSTNLIRVLDGYLGGELSDTEVEEWAEALEGRDDIGYDPKQAFILKQIVFELANPLLTTPIDLARANSLKDSLSEQGLP